MAVCCCSMAGTAACKYCRNNPAASDVWSRTVTANISEAMQVKGGEKRMNGCVYRTVDNKCEFYSDLGQGIVSYCDFDGCEEKKLSNADRIRAMTDEALAVWIHCTCRAAVEQHRLMDYEPSMVLCPSTSKDWLDWLRREVESR